MTERPTSESKSRARDFILRHARLLERQLFAFHFEGGAADPVLRALAAYQNADGGFGNALEPDKRAPASQPQDVEIAFHTLDDIGALNGDSPLVTRACDWLETITGPNGGVPFSLATANAPHAPWWGVKSDAPLEDINPTGAIAGLLLKNSVRHSWLDRANTYCWETIEASDGSSFHEVMCALPFLEHTADRKRAEPLMVRIAERVARPGVVALDPNEGGYKHGPLLWAPAPNAYLRRVFSDDVITSAIDALEAKQQADGGWPINWEPLSETVAYEWRGRVTVQALRTLRAYGV